MDSGFAVPGSGFSKKTENQKSANGLVNNFLVQTRQGETCFEYIHLTRLHCSHFSKDSANASSGVAISKIQSNF